MIVKRAKVRMKRLTYWCTNRDYVRVAKNNDEYLIKLCGGAMRRLFGIKAKEMSLEQEFDVEVVLRMKRRQ